MLARSVLTYVLVPGGVGSVWSAFIVHGTRWSSLGSSAAPSGLVKLHSLQRLGQRHTGRVVVAAGGNKPGVTRVSKRCVRLIEGGGVA